MDVKRQKRIFFTISGALVGIAGVILMARLLSAQPSVGNGYEVDAILQRWLVEQALQEAAAMWDIC